MSESTKGINSPMYGKHLSEETKRKIGDKNRGRKKTEEEIKKHIDSSRKLTDEQVIEIRNKYSMGNYTLTKLAEEYFVSYSVVQKIVNFTGLYKNII